jgi:8-oxo-dGTP diphosphatase
MVNPWQVTKRLPHGHCSYCGAEYAADAGWPRTCPSCGETVWRNPLPVALLLVPVLTVDEGAPGVVAVRRDIEPARGELCLPGGFIEFGETWEQAAARELREEAGLHADPGEVTLFDVASTGHHVLIFGTVPARQASSLPPSAATDESTEWVVLTKPETLAFPTHTDALAAFFAR